jgi:hypothetical protein
VAFIMLSGNADPDSVKAAASYAASYRGTGYIKKPHVPQRIAGNRNTWIMTLGPKS